MGNLLSKMKSVLLPTQEEPSLQDMVLPCTSSFCRSMETPELSSSTRKRSLRESDTSELHISKKARMEGTCDATNDAVTGAPQTLDTSSIMPQKKNKRPASRSCSPEPPYKKMKTDDAVNKETVELPGTSTQHSVQNTMPASFNLDSFTFHKILGQGSYGKVALATHNATGRQVAVKVVQKRQVLDEDPTAVLIERQVLERVESSNLFTHAFGTFQTEDNLFFVMEVMSGGELHDLMKSQGALPIDTIRFIAAEILSGLQHLHGLGIIHRDLKPENVLLDDMGHAKIADFGLSQVNISGRRKAASYCGTPDYMAPEIKSGERYGGIVDYYSFGVMLYEMVTGKDARLVRYRKFHYPRDLNPDLRDVIERLLTRCQKKRKTAVKNLRRHPFFRSINWVEVESGKAIPPLRMPQMKDIDTSEQIATSSLIPDVTGLEDISSAHRKLFVGFSFMSNKWRDGTYAT